MGSRTTQTGDVEVKMAPLVGEANTAIAAVRGAKQPISGRVRSSVGLPAWIPRGAPAWARAGAPAWVWLAVLVTAAGFVLLAIGWGQVAGETEVYLQMPYLVSGALVGIGVILVGVALLNVASRQLDARAREHQIDRLVAAVEELKDVLAATAADRGRSRR